MTMKTWLAFAVLAALVSSCAHHAQHASGHGHAHGANCGHVAVLHNGHADYLHDGHLHAAHGGHVDEHTLAVGTANPDQCTPSHACAAHGKGHAHGASCGHEVVPHGDHADYLVSGHLHHGHAGHCDDHGAIQLATK